MATLLWQRDISSDLSGVEHTYSSWDSCMSEAYWSVHPFPPLLPRPDRLICSTANGPQLSESSSAP
ncbi:hypothetical protein BAUCODRAFT_35882 [Baudoinia panamericana UAMH 10762]|uniref:Uncharacterized protein n=1 Tax=Baudoinia panamericana (strain UAMH 10762) TaxID=717646 RepID=M2N6G7_BAUPA|nr:uncharacterized protein BAUCODRAFT_35882 [Baudoinia panamericana UAMH 10762]EMC94644.1 hypothetical protein BAUCODRAFT_35882 [Baudoinia panamericana UAMH 10762]